MAVEREEILLTVKGMLQGIRETFKAPLEGMKALRQNVQGFNATMGVNIDNFKKMNKANSTQMNSGAALGNKIRLLTHGMRGFKMEMLGVMFFGMMLRKTFTSLLKPTAELFGIFDLWRVTLQIFFLPVVEKLFPWFLKLTEYLIEMNPAAQEAWGWFVVIGAVLGAILFIVGSFALGIGSLILVFGGAAIAALVMFMVFAGFLGVGFLIKGIIDILMGKWEGLGLAIMGVGIILAAFAVPWAAIPVALGAAVFLIIKHWDDIKMATGDAINWIVDKINILIEKLNVLPFVDIPLISGVGFGTPPTGALPASQATPQMFFDPAGALRERVGLGNNISIVQNNDISVSDSDEFEKMLTEDRDKLLDEVKNLVKFPASL